MNDILDRAYGAVGHPRKPGMQVPDKLQLEEQTFVNGYVKGATDQLKVDKEKVYHALEKTVSKEVLEELIKIMDDCL